MNMKKDSALYNLTQTMQGQIFYAAFMKNLSDEQRNDWSNRPPIMNIKRGYAESPSWIFVQALEFYPDPLNVEKFRKRAVYASPSLTMALLELLSSEHYFDRVGVDYFLTEKGHAEAHKTGMLRTQACEGFEPIATEQIIILENYLSRLIDASLQSEAISTWCLEHSRNRAPDNDAPPLAKVIQYGSDFNAFRDDAHMAAFGAYDIDGHVWEAFNYVQSEQAQAASGLYEKLAYRGFYTEDWHAALSNLENRGWIRQQHDIYTVTDDGLAIMEDVEAKTDAYFFAPWDVLSDEEYDDLITLMNSIIAACQALTS
ncbi:MAG: hypothetical protein WBC91_16090 [Phototrophicaceae bacterium]